MEVTNTQVISIQMWIVERQCNSRIHIKMGTSLALSLAVSSVSSFLLQWYVNIGGSILALVACRQCAGHRRKVASHYEHAFEWLLMKV